MSPKKLEPKSRYAQYDLDGDGVVTDEELARNQELVEIELREEKADSQRRMAWVSLSSMVVYALLPLMPFIPESRLSTLASLSDMLFLSQASIVGLYFWRDSVHGEAMSDERRLTLRCYRCKKKGGVMDFVHLKLKTLCGQCYARLSGLA